MKTIILALSIFISAPALASGGFDCKIDDANLKLEVSGGLPHGIPSGPFNTRGTLKFKATRLQKYNMNSITDVAQFWQTGDDLKVMLYQESASGEFHQTSVKIETVNCETCEYFSGSYVVSIFSASESQSQTLSGKVLCSLE